MKQINGIEDIVFLWKFVGKKRKFQLILLMLLMFLSTFAEIVSIGLIVPFLGVLTNPELLYEHRWITPFIKMLNINSKEELILIITIVFISAAIFASAIKISLLWANTYISASMGVDLQSSVYRYTLYRPYEFHIAHNSSDLLSIAAQKVDMTIQAGFMHVLLLVSALFTSLAIIVTLLIIDTFVAMMTFLVLGGGYMIIGYIVKKRVQKNGHIISKNQPIAIKCMQEGIGGIRDIIINNNQKLFLMIYSKIVKDIQYSKSNNIFLGNLPKSILEMISIVFIAILAYYLTTSTNKQEMVIPILGALALGAQKLLPSLQQVYFSWTIINGSKNIINDVVKVLKNPISHMADKDSIEPLAFKEFIKLKDVYFRYKGTNEWVLKDINLTIKKGSKVGFIGKTGSGKSTLLDIIMGLLKPQKGCIKIDDTTIDEKNIANWQVNIAHVPQSIFLSDATIAENIAFGIPKDDIDMKKVKFVAKQACLDEFIDTLPKGYDTFVGERGVKLSGGQRQRIGIARALYKEANVIVFDEATSALDNETEKSVMEAINSLDKDLTILIIAHRLSTLKGCDEVYKLEKGNINKCLIEK